MNERKNAPGIVLYCEDLDVLEELSDSQCGRLILALKASVQGAEVPEMDTATKVAYRFILPKVLKARENYEARAAQNRANGHKGGRPKTQKNPSVILENPNKTQKNPSVILENPNKTQKNPSVILENPNITEKTQLELEQELEQEKEIKEKKSIQKENINRVVDAWNALGLAKVTKVPPNSARERQLNARLKEHGIDGVLEAIDKVRQSEFLMGKSSGWRCTFDWLINASNMIKVLEGNYDDKPMTQKSRGYNRKEEQLAKLLEDIRADDESWGRTEVVNDS